MLLFCFVLFCFVCGCLCVRGCVCSIRHGESLKIGWETSHPRVGVSYQWHRCFTPYARNLFYRSEEGLTLKNFSLVISSWWNHELVWDGRVLPYSSYNVSVFVFRMPWGTWLIDPGVWNERLSAHPPKGSCCYRWADRWQGQRSQKCCTQCCCGSLLSCWRKNVLQVLFTGKEGNESLNSS